jgi:hypothetical protein
MASLYMSQLEGFDRFGQCTFVHQASILLTSSRAADASSRWSHRRWMAVVLLFTFFAEAVTASRSIALLTPT